jgi:hypothetical protein
MGIFCAKPIDGYTLVGSFGETREDAKEKRLREAISLLAAGKRLGWNEKE